MWKMGMLGPRSLLEVGIPGGVLGVYQVSVTSRGCSHLGEGVSGHVPC